MHGFAPHIFFLWLIALASIVCMLLRPWRVPEAIWISAGAILLVLTRLLSVRSAWHAVGRGTDVYLFLLGMMLLAELARHEGVFDWIADVAVKHANGSAARLFLLIYLTGVAVTALLSNDATAVVLTPAVLAAVRRAGVEPKPYLLTCALVANAASFILPISNPANLVVYGSHIPALGPWLRLFLLPSLVSVTVTYLCLRGLSRKTLRNGIHRHQEAVPLTPNGRIALAGLLLAAAALLIASGFGLDLGLPTCAAAVVAVVMVSLRDRSIAKRVLRDVSWSIIPLVAGLFILVEAMTQGGMLQLAQHALLWLLQAPRMIGALGAAFGVALLSNLMNNLPVALAAGNVLAHTHAAQPLAHAILIGVDLGPNLSVTGSLATILWLIALRREKVPITAGEFLRTGIIVMPAALLMSVLAQLLVG
jgi:arsenical pump membrane protein